MLRQVGYVPDDPDDLIEEITPSELWEFNAVVHSSVHGDVGTMLQTARLIADHLDFDPPDRPIAGFSHGMRRKTQLVAAVLHDPAVVIIDEPRNGLDPIGIERVEQLLADLRVDGRGIMVSTHDLGWAERFADRLAVLDRGVLCRRRALGRAPATGGRRVRRRLLPARRGRR